MRQLLSKMLSALGGLPLVPRQMMLGSWQDLKGLQAGKRNVGDIFNSDEWRGFLDSETLWRFWGPCIGSPWERYHCATLFSALDRFKPANGENRKKSFFSKPVSEISPLPEEELPGYLLADAALPSWATEPGRMLILDLPGSKLLAPAFQLISQVGFQPVCTFDNWPNQKGVLKPENILARLLYYAPALAEKRKIIELQNPPLWLCDHDRVTAKKPKPGEYDNRYIIEDRLLPGSRVLLEAGIHSLLYLRATPEGQPAPDLLPYLQELASLGFKLYASAIDTAESYSACHELELPPPIKHNLFSKDSTNPQMSMLVRSSAGGFGGYVPEASSGSGG